MAYGEFFRSCANNYKLVSFLHQKMYHPDLTPATLDCTETCALACKAKRRLQFPSPSEVHITFKLLVCVSLTGDRPSVRSCRQGLVCVCVCVSDRRPAICAVL